MAARHLLTPVTTPEPLWPHGAPVTGGRYTPRGGFPTIYLASDLPTAYFEVEGVLAVSGVPPRWTRYSPLVFVAVNGLLADMLDLTDAAIQTSLNTNHMELTGDWRLGTARGGIAPTQSLAQAAYDSGLFTGLIAPSSKSPENQIIAVFYDRLLGSASSRLAVHDPTGQLNQELP